MESCRLALLLAASLLLGLIPATMNQPSYECYACAWTGGFEQASVPGCNDPFSADSVTIVKDCFACSKSRLQYNDGQIVVIRACHDKEFNDTRELCLQDSLDYNEAYSVESCTCFSDACNDAASLRQRAPLVVAAMLALGAASWRCL